jgi:valyl-tRNA synthetase
MLSSGPYDPHKTEKKWSEIWEKKKYFQAEPKNSKKPYCILMPPPNVTGGLHMGHAMQHTIMDILARTKRMQGFDVLLQPGVDHAGILFQGTLEKKLSKEKRVTRQRLGREKFLEECWKFKEETYNSISKTFRFMGISADWSREKFTLSPEMTNSVYTAFEKLWSEGLIYKGKYIVQWCPRCSTAIEDVETEYQEREDKLYYVKYFFADDKDNFITIATTRPETMFADVAIAVNPTDKRFKNLIGKKVILPLADREIFIIADEKVDKDFGTGALKITPAHDLLDYEIGARNNLEKLQVIDKQGKLTELAGEFQGLKSLEAREKVVEKLEKKKYLEKIENYTHSVAVCERCKTTVEPIISEEWFVKTKPLAQEAIKTIKKNEIDFHPSRYGEILTDWLENIRDWCISRSLWWGHRMPVYYCQDCLKGDNTKGIIVLKTKPEKCPVCGSKDLKQEEQVLDTWFSSWLWPISTLGWPEQTEEFKKYFPADFEISAPEIKYLWIARMIMSAKKFTGEIPFKNMFFHGTMRDLKGKKFSKSLGNGFKPMEMIEKWGTDSLRAALTSYSIAARDIWVSKNTMDERCKNFRNFNNKIWNASKFVLMNLENGNNNAGDILECCLQIKNKDDLKILKHLNNLIKETTSDIENFKFHRALEKLYESFWHNFCDEYIEAAKDRLKNDDEKSKNINAGDDTDRRLQETKWTLLYCLKTYLKLLHPFIPFITEEIWEKIPFVEKNITVSDWPKEIKIKS